MSSKKSSPDPQLYYLSYHPTLIEVLGSERAAILFNRLEYWFKLKPDGFYKFIAPCHHRLYKVGDSWCEELGISRPTFNKAFSQIGRRYESKSALDSVTEPFQGKFYVSYFHRQDRLIYYMRNHQAIEQLFLQLATPEPLRQKAALEVVPQSLKTNSLITTPCVEVSQVKAQGLDLQDNSQTENFFKSKTERNFKSRTENIFRSKTENFSLQTERNFRSRTERNFRSPYIQNIPTKVTSFSLETEKANFAKKEFSVSKKNEIEKIKKIWLEEIGDLGAAQDQPSLLQKLAKTFQGSFASNLQAWRRYCRLISSSKFLMGESDSSSFKKVWMTWAIKPETIQRILAGEFTLGDRSTLLDLEYQKQLEKIKDLNNEKELVSTRLLRLEEDVKKNLKHKIAEAVARLGR